jgi:hypothetical protein
MVRGGLNYGVQPTGAAPHELKTFNGQTLMNLEFEQPLPSRF